MKKASVKRLYRTAIHESGHAVMAFEKGMKNLGVTIIPDSDILGSCKTDNMFYRVDVDIVGCLDPKYPKHFYNALRHAMRSFAGAMSE